MLGARVIAYHDPPKEGAELRPPSLEQVLPSTSLRGVHTLFLGFPVWGEKPSPPVLRFVSSQRFEGVRVVPFYSFIHNLQPSELESLREAVRARGGEVLTELAFLIPLAVTNEDLDSRARRSLLARRDLWSDGREEIQAPACGARNGRDGAELCHVPAGLAWLGDGGPSPPPGAPPPRRVRVGSFDIDRTEVTVTRYEKCVSAGKCAAIDSTSFCRTLLAEPGDRGALPQPCATYVAADAYCRWAGMRVPTEAEWIRAGRGDTTRAYPWGDAFATPDSPARGNFGEKRSFGFDSYSTVPEDSPWTSDGFRGLAPPCTFPAGSSGFGLCDLAGNLAEWVETGKGGAAHVAKGGSWLDGETAALRVGSSAELPPVFARDIGIYVNGIRCARDAR